MPTGPNLILTANNQPQQVTNLTVIGGLPVTTFSGIPLGTSDGK